MTRANANRKLNSWVDSAGAARAIVPISRPVDLTTFAIKGGGYGCFLGIQGKDQEGMTEEAIEATIHTIEGALHGLPEGSTLYQYTRLRNGYTLPREPDYGNPVTEAFAQGRLDHLDKTAGFRRIDLHWVLTMQPSRINPFQREPREHNTDNNRLLAEFHKSAAMLEQNLSNELGLTMQPVERAVQFFSYLFNLEDWAGTAPMREDVDLDVQIAGSTVVWHPDHLRIGKRFAQTFSLTMTPVASRPCLFSGLMDLHCDAVLCTTWRPKSSAKVHKEAASQEKFADFFKVSLLKRGMAGKDFDSLDEGAKGQAAKKKVSKIGDALTELDEKSQGEYTLKLLLSSRSREELQAVLPAVHTAFVTARAPVLEETTGNLSAFYAMFPGNQEFNVFPLWLGEDHNARLASIFAPTIGHLRSEALDHEYLNVLETRTGTPYFKDAYVEGVRVQLVIAPTRVGKSVHVNQEIALGQKYNGWDFIFDIGGSYESLVELYGGKVDRVGLDGPRLNPFSLPATDANIKFLHIFVKLLLTSGGAVIGPEDDDEIYGTVRNMWNLRDPAMRRLGNLILPSHLQRYLTKWVGDGVYAKIFDNAEDSLQLARVQCFDFQGLGKQYADLIEPLMVWLLRRIDDVTYDPANLGVPKHVVIEELFANMKNKQLLEGALSSIKTGGKHLGGVTLISQSAIDLGENAENIVNSCSSFLFLRDPSFNRARYRELFAMDDQQIALLASLKPREGLYIRRDGETKVVILNLDARSYAAFTTKPKDRIRRSRLVAQYGLSAGLDAFAAGEGL